MFLGDLEDKVKSKLCFGCFFTKKINFRKNQIPCLTPSDKISILQETFHISKKIFFWEPQRYSSEETAILRKDVNEICGIDKYMMSQLTAKQRYSHIGHLHYYFILCGKETTIFSNFHWKYLLINVWLIINKCGVTTPASKKFLMNTIRMVEILKWRIYTIFALHSKWCRLGVPSKLKKWKFCWPFLE